MSYQKRIQKILSQLDDVIEKSKQDAVKMIYAQLQSRIFREGKDKFENALSPYSEGYKKVRKKKGRQTAIKDLVFTGQLQESVISDSIDTVRFKNNYGKTISGYIEKNEGRRIFAPSRMEAEIYFDEITKNLTKLWKS